MKFGSTQTGLGDVLVFNAVMKHFPMQHTMQLQPNIERFKILFDHICKVEITDTPNFLEDLNRPITSCAGEKLRNFFGEDADHLDFRPNILHFDIEKQKEAANILSQYEKPVIFVPFCSKTWAHERNMPDQLIQSAITSIKDSGGSVILCSQSNNRKEIECVDEELINLDLSLYIHILRNAGAYVGCNTGDMHLAVGVGCDCSVFNPTKEDAFYKIWCYKHPNVTNYTWS